MKRFTVTSDHLKLLNPSLTLTLNPNDFEDEEKITEHVRTVLGVELLEERCLALYEQAQIALRVSKSTGENLIGTYEASENNNWKKVTLKRNK